MSMHSELESLQTEIKEKEDLIQDVVAELRSISSDDSINEILQTVTNQADDLEKIAGTFY